MVKRKDEIKKQEMDKREMKEKGKKNGERNETEMKAKRRYETQGVGRQGERERKN